MITFLSGCVIGLVVGAIFAILWWAHRTPVDGLPCPHPMCRNRLPRQAALAADGISWADEDCSVCLGRVRFTSEYSAYSGLQGSQDRWVRVHVPEAKA